MEELEAVCEDSWEEALDALRVAAPLAPMSQLASALGSRRRVRTALAGDWAPLLDGVDRAASECAFAGIPRHASLTVLDAFTEALVPRAVDVYRHAPARLASALRALRELSSRVAATIDDAYLATPRR